MKPRFLILAAGFSPSSAGVGYAASTESERSHTAEPLELGLDGDLVHRFKRCFVFPLGIPLNGRKHHLLCRDVMERFYVPSMAGDFSNLHPLENERR